MTKDMEEELHEQLERQRRWAAMTPEQKKKQLFLDQKELLDKFLERNAISREQYDRSVGVLRRAAG